MRHLTAGDFQVSTWSGGKTIQIAISPEGAAYADRDFLWRVSSATVELDESAGGEDAASCRPAGTKASYLSDGAHVLLRLRPEKINVFHGTSRTTLIRGEP